MPTNYKVLGQVAPGATTATTLYTVPSATETVISTLVVANRGATATNYRIAVRPNAATLSNEHYIVFDIIISGNDTTTLTMGITVDAGDVITVFAGNTNLTFTAFGSEITA
jgi:hypothetical protein